MSECSAPACPDEAALDWEDKPVCVGHALLRVYSEALLRAYDEGDVLGAAIVRQLLAQEVMRMTARRRSPTTTAAVTGGPP